MNPFYMDDFVKIYNANSQNLDFVSDNSVELIITSPPYNVDMNYDFHDDSMCQNEYINSLEKVFRECYRVLVPGGRIAINIPSNCKQTTASKEAYVSVKVHNLLEKIGFLPREWIGWIKIPEINAEQYDKAGQHQGWGNCTSWGSWKSPSCPYIRDIMEYIIVMDKEKSKLDGDKSMIDITKEEFLKFTNNAWFILPTTSRRTHHPASFPEQLPYRLIKLYSYQGNTILDPFGGSGTTGYIAKQLKRKSILVDVSRPYCELMKNNCSQEYFNL